MADKAASLKTTKRDVLKILRAAEQRCDPVNFGMGGCYYSVPLKHTFSALTEEECKRIRDFLCTET